MGMRRNPDGQVWIRSSGSARNTPRFSSTSSRWPIARSPILVMKEPGWWRRKSGHDANGGGKVRERGDSDAVGVGIPAAAVDEHREESGPASRVDVEVGVIADVDRFLWRNARTVERNPEDGRIRLLHALDSGDHPN